LKSFEARKIDSDNGKQSMCDSKSKDSMDIGELGKKGDT
jgi:hypothetical protein